MDKKKSSPENNFPKTKKDKWTEDDAKYISPGGNETLGAKK